MSLDSGSVQEAVDAARCGHCTAPAGAQDQYCGSCGRPLVALAWRVEGGPDHFELEGSVAVRPEKGGVELEFRNDGSVPVHLVLTQEAVRALPDWVEQDRLVDKTIILDPGAAAELTIPVRPELPNAEGNAPAREGTAALTLVTSLVEFCQGKLTQRAVKLTMAMAREPRADPRASFYPFIPWEVVEQGELEHTICVTNESPNPLLFFDAIVEDVPVTDEEGLRRVSLSEVLQLPAKLSARLDPGECLDVPVRFAQRGAQNGPEPSWFHGEVVLPYCAEQDPEALGELRVTLHGRLGRGPRVEVVSGSVKHHTFTLDESDPSTEFELTNSGAIPVQVVDVAVERRVPQRYGGPVTEWETVIGRDWVTFTGIDQGALLRPGDRVTVSMRADRASRPDDEMTRDWCHRRLRVRHDGWANDDDSRDVLQEFAVEFAKEELLPPDVHVGFDFGTSNSTVCIVKDDNYVALPLEFPDAIGPVQGNPVQMRSLMYFKPEGGHFLGAHAFRYGQDAHSWALANPANLVRSLKWVASREPERGHDFSSRVDGRITHHAFTGQELVDSFIHQLRLRAERALSELTPAQRRELGLKATRVRLRRGVFTHPVEATPPMRSALMRAAANASLFDPGDADAQTAAELFERTACIDESTAAVLAFIWGQFYGWFEGKLRPMSDEEHVVCFDIGGGSTDIAAAAVHDVASTLAEEKDQVHIELRATDGDNDFGGDFIDERLATALLERLALRARAEQVELQVSDVRQAIESRSWTEFRAWYERGHGDSPDRSPLDVYRRAREVLQGAEEAKIALGTHPSFTVEFSAAEWPVAGDPGDSANLSGRQLKVTQDEFASLVKDALAPRLQMLDSVVREAGWSWGDVSILMFTGQTSRIPAIREAVIAHAHAARSNTEPLVVVDPNTSNLFCPKRCVAVGAAIWGSAKSGGWLSLTRRMTDELGFDLRRRSGPVYRKVDGLVRGASLPAQAVVKLGSPHNQLSLYRGKTEYINFRFPSATEVKIVYHGPGHCEVQCGGRSYRGVFLG